MNWSLFFLIMAILVGCKYSDNEANNLTKPGELDQKVLSNLGDFTNPPPDGWQQFSQTGDFCFHLPANYQEETVQGIDSLVRQFNGEEGFVGLDYGIFSAGQNITRTSGTVDGRNVSVTLIEVEETSGTFGAENLYTIYMQVDGQLYLDMTYYALVDDHLNMAKQIFGTVRIGSQCP